MATTMLASTSPRSDRVMRKRARGRFYWLRFALALVIALVMLFPLYWMLLTAVSTKADLYRSGLHLWPAHFTLDNFRDPIRNFPVTRWFRNSLVIAVLVTVITVLVNLLAGFAFAKLNFRGKNPIFLLLLSTMMIPIQAIMVAQFKLVVKLNMFGSIWAVILPSSASVFGIFLARQFFIAIPDELLEAARCDGAGIFRTFRSIVLPLCRPLVAVLTLMTFMYEWNDFTWPLIVFFSDNQKFTVPIGLVTDIKGQYTTNYGAIMAMSLLMALPMVVLFVAFQKYFVQGLARSGIK
ncbi:carbohydrate ABC transporter permease [Jatrophihabitans telluris]|uniref:Carbohydrate ABC transporter permease n=1 Tax=Jatrophihabitans telluris TaxID=2038343 RepID=A0ABY4QXX4_9ACTN|nr:carbohydrate ABC transporter permease [Jatrophihabitans telluris]UQX88229.1 carbohydrate ABC transporter permease [Jatrophihabitans telluris]